MSLCTPHFLLSALHSGSFRQKQKRKKDPLSSNPTSSHVRQGWWKAFPEEKLDMKSPHCQPEPVGLSRKLGGLAGTLTIV